MVSDVAIRAGPFDTRARAGVVGSTVVPSATRCRITSRTPLRLLGSRPVVGSSRTRRLGAVTKLAAMPRRRRIPPE